MMSATVHTDPIAGVLFWIVCIFSFGLVGRYLARLCQQPAVLGELLMGILLGNVCYLFAVSQMVVLREGPGIFEIVHHLLMGLSMQHAVALSVPHANDVARLVPILHSNSGFEWVQVAHAIDVLAQYGVIFLLFMVGLESSVQDIRETGMESLCVALIGVFCPILLGFGMMLLLMPEASVRTNLFVAATLSATSVGITARVLKEMKKLRTREAKTILGAAVIDDILGLIILALVSSVVI
ncbi:MAG: sodium:proton antiporter, partial [Legionella sp. 21-45-4]